MAKGVKKSKTQKTDKKQQNNQKSSKHKSKKQTENENNEEFQTEPEISKEELQQKYNSNLEIVKKELLPQISDSQISKALKALEIYKTNTNGNTINVLSNNYDDFIYLNFAFNKYPMRYSLSSNQILLKNGLYGSKFSSNICLIVKDPKSDFKDLQIEFPFNLKIIDIQKLKLKYTKYENRRELMKKYDLFFCDSRILFVLRKLLGKCFYKSKKYPHPLTLNYENKEEIKNNLIQAVTESTYFNMNNGPIYNVKFGRFSMDLKENCENLKKCLEESIPHILKYDVLLEELRTISIKGNNTVELPIYNHIRESDLKIFTKNK